MVGEFITANLWFIPFIALAIQIVTTVYFFRIRRFIGKNLRLIFAGFHVLGYTYIAFMMHALFLAGEVEETPPLEVYAIFFGLIYPCFNGLLHLGVKRVLFEGMKPNTKREVMRDMERDHLRDPIRDDRRDKRKDMEEHVDDEEEKKERQRIRDEEREEYKEEDRLTRVDERTDDKEEDRATRADEMKDERDIRHTDERRREQYEGDAGKVHRTHLEEKDDPESTREEKHEEERKE